MASRRRPPGSPRCSGSAGMVDLLDGAPAPARPDRQRQYRGGRMCARPPRVRRSVLQPNRRPVRFAQVPVGPVRHRGCAGRGNPAHPQLLRAPDSGGLSQTGCRGGPARRLGRDRSAMPSGERGGEPRAGTRGSGHRRPGGGLSPGGIAAPSARTPASADSDTRGSGITLRRMAPPGRSGGDEDGSRSFLPARVVSTHPGGFRVERADVTKVPSKPATTSRPARPASTRTRVMCGQPIAVGHRCRL